MKKILNFGLLILLITSSCNKHKDEHPNPIPGTTNNNNGELLIINNPANANATDGLQAIYTDSSGMYQGYYYGTFASDGKPDQITQLIINKIAGDTSVNIFFDSSMRVKTLYLTIGGIKTNSLLSFDYSINGKVILNAYYFDFASDSSKLMEQITCSDLGDGSYGIDGHSLYKRSQNHQLVSSLNVLNQTSSDPFITRFVSANAAIPVLNAIIVVGMTGIGCSMGLCVVGGIIGTYMAINPASANAGEISTPPANTPPSPAAQTQGTQFQTKKILVGTNPSSGIIPFGGSPYCHYTVEYSYIVLQLKIKSQTQIIESANVYGTMTETIEPGCLPGDPYAAAHRHEYTLRDYTYNGSSVTIYFKAGLNNFPQNDAVFTGNVNGPVINGTLMLSRNDGMTCNVNAQLKLTQVN